MAAALAPGNGRSGVRLNPQDAGFLLRQTPRP